MRAPAVVIVLGVFALLQVVVIARDQAECADRIAACAKRPKRPVCGSDDKTYTSRCQLLRQHCVTGAVSVRHRGPCGGKTRRGSFSRDHKHRKDCSRIDRSTFVTNLVKIFRTEYIRQPHVVVNASEDNAEADRRVLEWKFNSLDINGDLLLSREEYRALRELVRKVVKPKRCARVFSKHCDLDRDTNIAQQEWITCLGLDVNPGADDEEEVEGEGEGDFSDDSPLGVLQESAGSLTGQVAFREDGGDRKDEAEVTSDCQTDRQAVLDEMRTNNNEMYIPECTPDGRYQKVQCYRSTGYCWCVYEDSGTTIPGTSVKDENPKCDAIQPMSRPMKGCPEQRKQAFLRELLDFLTLTMTSQKSSNITIKDTLDSSQEEQIATWNFNVLDSNKNKVLEKNEWKAFRSLISSHRKLRRCGKKLPRYCDINHDRKISLTEWLHCLNAQRPISDASAAPTPNPRRKGPNPLESYLKGDD